MRKRILIALAVALIGTSAVGCSNYEDAKVINTKTCGGNYFTIIKEWCPGDGTYDLVYANDTKVMYLIVYRNSAMNVTPLYNADGSLQIYNGEE